MPEIIDENERKQIVRKYLNYQLLKIPREFLARNYQLLIILSQILLAEGYDDLQPCNVLITCPTYSSTDYFLYVDSCFKELNYGIWSECRCPRNAADIFNKVSQQIGSFTCGAIAYNAVNCVTKIFNYTIGTFHGLVFKKDADPENYNSFDPCVTKLINNAYEETQLPWSILAYVALGLLGCCALGATAYGTAKLVKKWHLNHQQQKRIKEASPTENYDETSPLFSL